jgi:hypothetical protein
MFSVVQECLTPAERRQILEELGRDSLPDVCQSIDNLNTALAFLKALGGSPTMHIHAFMTGALRMKRTVHSHKVGERISE